MSTTSVIQPALLRPVPAVGRFMVFDLVVGSDPRPALARWRDTLAPDETVVGVGLPLVLALGASIPGLRAFPSVSGPGVTFPSTQGALYVFLAGSSASELHDRSTAVCAVLGEQFKLREEVAAFRYRNGHDLTGFEDGTENPKAENAVAAAIISGAGAGLDGSSFVAVQRYIHDLEGFARLPGDARNATIGRDEASNAELPDAPASAHIKRTTQESFDPPAFMLRRSMPWGGASERGLFFVAYGESLDRFERVLKRMAGIEDGVVDGLLRFSRAVSGGYYWCPPVRGGPVDWTALGV